jgi:xanthine dehydrogenase accessory factor
MHEDVFTAVAGALASGTRAVLATIVQASGSTPQRVGAKMLVYEDGRTVGTIGGGCYEDDAIKRARAMMRQGRPRLVKYDLNDDFAEESGLICGGQMDVFLEPIAPATPLYVIGGGHVGQYVSHVGALAGFRTHVLDDREKFANAERFPEASEIVVDDIGTWLAQHRLPAGAFIVIVTRGHRHDLDALRQLLDQDLGYLGMIGSRAKIARVYDALLAEGVSPERLQPVHAPIGLDLGAVTPAEIAVAIVAELIAVKYGKLAPGTEAGEHVVRALGWDPPTVRAVAAR